MRYNVTVSILGKSFKIKNIEAYNKDDAEAKAIRKAFEIAKASTHVLSSENVDIVGDILNMFGWKK